MAERPTEELTLAELVDLFDELEGKRTPVGWTFDDAVLKSTVERRILEIVGAKSSEGERRDDARIPCELPVVIRAKDREASGTLTNIGYGGAFVASGTDLPVGSHVYLEIEETRAFATVRARGRIAWRRDDDSPGVGVSFADQPSAAHERRLRRFVLELLERRGGP